MGYIMSELWDAICMNYGIQKLTVLLAYVPLDYSLLVLCMYIYIHCGLPLIKISKS